MARGALANICWLCGEFEAARTHAEQGMLLYTREHHHGVGVLYSGRDPGVAQRSGSAVSLWVLGYPDYALQRSDAGIVLARELAHRTSIVFALVFDAMVHQHRRESRETRRQAEAAIALATEQDLAQWLAWGTALRGWALVVQGELEDGMAQLREGLAGWRAVRGGALAPYFLALQADAYAQMGRAEEGLDTVAEALAITDRTHESYMEAELYRLKGELLKDTAAAEACLRQAIEIARRQQAKSFELRAVTSLVRRFQPQGRQTEAHRMLSELYGWFTEGFDALDLKEARALLDKDQAELDKANERTRSNWTMDHSDIRGSRFAQS
jgi:adenylate cyclase